MRLRLPHLLHRDPGWEIRGVHEYHQCRCGARRIRRAYANLDGPPEPGWPSLRDRHGLPLADSGWRPPATWR